MAILDDVKLILDITGIDEDALLNTFIGLSEDAVLAYTNLTALPVGLEFIVIETTVERYRRMGSEGITSETVDVVRQDFTKELLDPYKDILKEYKKSTGSGGSVKFI